MFFLGLLYELLTYDIYYYLVAIPGLSGEIFRNAAKMRETVLSQRVGAQGLSIADS
jgi:hypothetical protein